MTSTQANSKKQSLQQDSMGPEVSPSQKTYVKGASPTRVWQGRFGQEYTRRNYKTVQEKEAIFHDHFGITRTELNLKFLKTISRSSIILEVGCNIATQLLILQNLGFTRLYGLELQSQALHLAQQHSTGINLIQGSAQELPFTDNSFDLIFTSELLIHITPESIHQVLQEIYRCSKKFIWGYEYYSDRYEEVTYRGEKGLLWKTDFVKLYQQAFPNLKLIKEARLHYKKRQDLTDTMFLLEKQDIQEHLR